jgi:hypothetical protein
MQMNTKFTTDGQDLTAWPVTETETPTRGVQRLSVARPDRWLALEYGMFSLGAS